MGYKQSPFPIISGTRTHTSALKLGDNVKQMKIDDPTVAPDDTTPEHGWGKLGCKHGKETIKKAIITYFTGGLSDRRLKKNINLIGESPSGLNIYSFEYKNSKHGEGLFQGVMSDEIPQEAVINTGKYDMVNYNMLDVEFKKL